jgi:predicted HTH transcriptional regulator
MTKMTKKVALSKAIEALREREEFGEVVEKLEAMLAQVEKEASREKSKGPKALAKEAEGVAFAQKVREFVAEREGVSAKECAVEFGVSPQKVSAALSKLVKAGEVKREIVKGKAVFTA